MEESYQIELTFEGQSFDFTLDHQGINDGGNLIEGLQLLVMSLTEVAPDEQCFFMANDQTDLTCLSNKKLATLFDNHKPSSGPVKLILKKGQPEEEKSPMCDDPPVVENMSIKQTKAVAPIGGTTYKITTSTSQPKVDLEACCTKSLFGLDPVIQPLYQTGRGPAICYGCSQSCAQFQSQSSNMQLEVTSVEFPTVCGCGCADFEPSLPYDKQATSTPESPNETKKYLLPIRAQRCISDRQTAYEEEYCHSLDHPDAINNPSSTSPSPAPTIPYQLLPQFVVRPPPSEYPGIIAGKGDCLFQESWKPTVTQQIEPYSTSSSSSSTTTTTTTTTTTQLKPHVTRSYNALGLSSDDLNHVKLLLYNTTMKLINSKHISTRQLLVKTTNAPITASSTSSTTTTDNETKSIDTTTPTTTTSTATPTTTTTTTTSIYVPPTSHLNTLTSLLSSTKLPSSLSPQMRSIISRIRSYASSVYEYETQEWLMSARLTIPIAQLELKAIEKMKEKAKELRTELDQVRTQVDGAGDKDIGDHEKAKKIHGLERQLLDVNNNYYLFRDYLMRELLSWFKHEFFKWTNGVTCTTCNQECRTLGGTRPTEDEAKYGASICEIHQCPSCHQQHRFPRYNHALKLLETRKGRCGEWAQAFMLCCRAMGYETRHVHDWTDHVWVEYYSHYENRYIHCDSCENSWDGNNLYEAGWGKQLNLMVAISKDEVVDVTRRYTRKLYGDVGRRRAEMGLNEWQLRDYISRINTAQLLTCSHFVGMNIDECITLQRLVGVTIQHNENDLEGRIKENIEREKREGIKMYTKPKYISIRDSNSNTITTNTNNNNDSNNTISPQFSRLDGRTHKLLLSSFALALNTSSDVTLLHGNTYQSAMSVDAVRHAVECQNLDALTLVTIIDRKVELVKRMFNERHEFQLRNPHPLWGTRPHIIFPPPPPTPSPSPSTSLLTTADSSSGIVDGTSLGEGVERKVGVLRSATEDFINPGESPGTENVTSVLRQPRADELQGRQTGSLEWRLARGELGNDKPNTTSQGDHDRPSS